VAAARSVSHLATISAGSAGEPRIAGDVAEMVAARAADREDERAGGRMPSTAEFARQATV
jgi:hypothetical protein